MNRSEFTSRLNRAERIVIKVGSARLSGEDRDVNDFLYSLVGDIQELKEHGKQVILVSSGAVAQGKKVISRYKMLPVNGSTPERQALASLGQNQLMNLYEGFFSKVNIPIGQILFGTLDLEAETGYKNLENTFEQLLSWNVVPIVNENDSIAIEELKLGDNDILSALVSLIVKADLLIILTGVDGFLKEEKRVEYMSQITDDELQFARGPEGPGTGGMNTKLKAARILLTAGVPTAIVNGKVRHCVQKLIRENQIGTLVANSLEKRTLSEREIKNLFLLK
jgi:glutamate 5-kinase